MTWSSNIKPVKQARKPTECWDLLNGQSYKDEHILVGFYKSLVRPHLEYCCSAWSPRYVKDEECYEKVQHHFTGNSKTWDLDHIGRLDHFGLWTLEECRNRADLTEVFKLCTSLPQSTRPFLSAWGHSLKIRKPGCHKDIRK